MTDSTELAPINDLKAKFPNGVWTSRARRRLERLTPNPAAFGAWEGGLTWSSRIQEVAAPVPFQRPRALFFAGRYPDGWDAGAEDDVNVAMTDVETQHGVIGEPPARAGISTKLVEVSPSLGQGGPLLDSAEVEDAVLAGREVADKAIDAGHDVLLMTGLGTGAQTAAVAVCATFVKNDITNFLPTLVHPDGTVNDAAWMDRIVSLRDHLGAHRGFERRPEEIIARVAGAELGAMAAAIVTASARRTPVLLDGVTGAAAAMVARDVQLAAPKWCYMPNRPSHPVIDKLAAQAGFSDGMGLDVNLGDGAGLIPGWNVLQEALRTSELFGNASTD